ncbi:MAG: helix-hairpin-helix domain-containing protein, partial [Candidatus Omnitrophica bacterium]|nr:helix-hairpin-helix domain-containing protein [Candidatus Omnitrophota bacterium]
MTGQVDKNKVIAVLEEIAILLELKNEIVFKVRAYENAARALEGSPRDLDELVETGELSKLKGIGAHLEAIILDLYRNGRSVEYETMRREFPDTLFELFRVPGLGAKRIKVLYEKLKIKSVADLEKACLENRLSALEGFGAKSQGKILLGVLHFKKSRGHFRIDFAEHESGKISGYLRGQKGIMKMEVAGSIRRRKEIVKDIDILVSAQNPQAIHDAFVRYPETESVIAHGDTKSGIVLKSGMNCDLRTVSVKEFPCALYYFTGSKEHNVAVRTLAKKQSIKINEYGLFKGKKVIPCPD